MKYLTPTAWAEEGYQAKLKQHRPMPIGPAGYPIPDERAIYRSTVDPGLLKQLVTAAYVAACKREVPADADARAAEIGAQELLRLYPPADMEVLARYDLTDATDRLLIDTVGIGYQKPVWLTLAEPILVPKGGFRLYINLGEPWAPTCPEAPPELAEYCHKLRELRGPVKRTFDAAIGWPSQFKVRNGRWPRWIEIEREHPALGQWMAGQRAGIGRTSKIKGATS